MRLLRLCHAVGCVLILLPICRGQDTDANQEELKREFFTAAMQIQIAGGPTGSEAFELVTKPVLNWSNPERQTVTGALYFWTLNARPQVALCLYPTPEVRFDSELQSLSPWPLTAKVNDLAIWGPQSPGVVMKPFTDTVAVANTAPGRMLQMRNLAKEFSAKLVPPNRTTIPLRLLPTPIYRYPEPGPTNEWVDGAVFAFVQGTDPEVLVIIESIAGEDKELAWHYGVARMSMVPTELSHRDQIVWQTTWAIQDRSGTYFVYKNK